MKPVFAYTRVSTVRQGTQGSSLSEQHAAIQRYAAQNGLTVIQWFEEQETAAKRGRPVFARMMKLLIQQKASGIIIHKIDRSARNLRDWADLGELVDKGIEIHLAHESLDMRSRGGRLAADIQAVVAADFIRNLRDEVKKGMRGRLKQGLFPLPAPIGYLNQGGGKPKIPDPVTAPIIHRLYELYASGRYTLDTLLIEAHKLGLRNRKGSLVAKSSLAEILKCEFYTGIISIKSEAERYEGIHFPIISTALFENVRRVRLDRKVMSGLKNELAYRKLLRCRGCQRYVTGEIQKGRTYYRCHSKACARVSVREDALENQILMCLETVTIPEDMMPRLHAEIEYLRGTEQRDQEGVISALKLQIGQIDARLNRLMDAYLDGVLDKQSYAEKQQILFSEKAIKMEAIAEITSPTGKSSTRVQEMFELQKGLQQAKRRQSSAQIVELMKSTSSNWEIEGKNVLFEPASGLREAANFHTVHNGEPYRDRRRTLMKKSPRKLTAKQKKALTDIAKGMMRVH